MLLYLGRPSKLVAKLFQPLFSVPYLPRLPSLTLARWVFPSWINSVSVLETLSPWGKVRSVVGLRVNSTGLPGIKHALVSLVLSHLPRDARTHHISTGWLVAVVVVGGGCLRSRRQFLRGLSEGFVQKKKNPHTQRITSPSLSLVVIFIVAFGWHSTIS